MTAPDRRRELLALYVAWIAVFGAAVAGGGIALGLFVDVDSLGTLDDPNLLGAANDVGNVEITGDTGNVANDGTDDSTGNDGTDDSTGNDGTDDSTGNVGNVEASLGGAVGGGLVTAGAGPPGTAPLTAGLVLGVFATTLTVNRVRRTRGGDNLFDERQDGRTPDTGCDPNPGGEEGRP